jgi:hypothetical protein
MQRFHRALMQLCMSQDEVYCQDGSLFDRVAYSRFKYGHTPPARQYGIDLARLIESDLLEKRGDRPTIIISAPYKFVPTASHGIALAMRHALAARFVESGIEPPVVVPFHKTRTGTDTYAMSSLEERLRMLATLGLNIDERLVREANVLVVDDIRITGTAQATTAAFIESLAPYSVWYLHAARLSERASAEHPGIEDELNQSVPKSISTVLRDIQAGEFMLNARVLGFIMKAADQAAFKKLLSEAPDEALEQLHEATLCSGLQYVARFPHSLQQLNDELQGRGLLSAIPDVYTIRV